MLCSLLNDWNYFWNKYCNLPFLAICLSPTSPFDISCVILKSKSKNWAVNELAKQKNDYHIKGLYKTKKKLQLFSFIIFSLTAAQAFFLSPYQEFANFEKLTRFHWQAFTVYVNGENLKMLIEIFRQKLIVSSIILAFLDHLKPKIFFVSQPCWPTLSATLFQNLGICSCKYLDYCTDNLKIRSL